ncbi:MAG: glutamate--tRNA ligase [Victivallaceae bacterium]|nr:glutamate--tRNA ligase [Victivallaceae bacterium]
MSIRVRFAPSPTGQVHIGNIRTAIFNWLFARHSNGAFILRIEDTDLERSTDDAKQKLFECLEWLGLDYDGEVMYQSQRREIYLAEVEKMLQAGSAYNALAEAGVPAPVMFRLPLDTADNPVIRNVGMVQDTIHAEVPVEISSAGITFAQVSRKGKPMPVAASLAGFRQLKVFDSAGAVLFDLEAKLEALLNGETFSCNGGAELSFLRKEVFFTDIIKGEMAKPLDGMKDLVIVRSDGSPIFHIANVCDDNAQQITHVVRGDDHVENTYRHILLFNALGYNIPEYAHMPMIVNQAGKPYSKRDGDAFVGDFRDNGILADALLNYLSLLGWSPGDDREKMSRSELIEAFKLERVKSAPAQLDMKKLINMNGAYIAEMPLAGFIAATWQEFLTLPFADESKRELFDTVAELMQQRTKQFSQVSDWNYFFTDDFERNAKAFKKSFKREENRLALAAVAEAFAALEEFTAETLQATISTVEQRQELHEGQLNLPLRLAVTGTNAGGDILTTLSLIGQERSLARIKTALADFAAAVA